MSRSSRKPYIGTCGSIRGAMKKWKKQSNRKIRKVLEIPSGQYYKKMTNSWSAPDDGKCFLGEEMWAYRK